MLESKPVIWAWATHHDEPLLLPTEGEAAAYCDDESPEALISLSEHESVLAKLSAHEAVTAELVAAVTACVARLEEAGLHYCPAAAGGRKALLTVSLEVNGGVSNE